MVESGSQFWYPTPVFPQLIEEMTCDFPINVTTHVNVSLTLSVVGLSVFAREQVGHDIISSHYQL